MGKRMKKVDRETTHQLSAAIGWLELGNSREALAELERIAPEYQKVPAVLEVRWMLYTCEADWENALWAARELMAVAPGRPESWLHQAYSARRAPGGSVEGAWEALLPAMEKFPKEATIPYNLACYACQMGRLEEAGKLLRRAWSVGEPKTLKEMAMADRDLEPLWEEIKRW